MQANSVTMASGPYSAGVQTGRPPKRKRTEFGERLHAAREALGLSQTQVAEQLGLSQSGYASWERDKVSLRPDQIEQLTRILNVSLDYLFGSHGNKPRGKGPVGRLRRVFDEVSNLPRHQQQRIVTMVEDVLAGYRAQQSKAA